MHFSELDKSWPVADGARPITQAHAICWFSLVLFGELLSGKLWNKVRGRGGEGSAGADTYIPLQKSFILASLFTE